jgi:hypothetical protein
MPFAVATSESTRESYVNWLATGSCEAIVNFSWLVGALAGVLLDAFLLIAIAQTPHLREHGGEADPIGFVERWILPLPPYLIALLWFWGLCHVAANFFIVTRSTTR